MSTRVWIIVLVGLLLVTTIGGAAIIAPVEHENVIEGHIVFTTIEQPAPGFNNTTKATAVAVLVRESTSRSQSDRFPGVLWSNDQYLVDPSESTASCSASGGFHLGPISIGGGCESSVRYPCTGAVLAVNAGDPDPRMYQMSDYVSHYVETYNVTDPNNHKWTINKWNMTGDLIWSVSMDGEGYDSTSSFPDDGHCNRKPYKDSASHKNNPTDYGYPGYSYPCGGVDGDPCSKQLQYNAVLFFYLDDLKVNGTAKDHTPGSYNYTHDVSGCDENHNNQFTDNWPCPAGDDNREGNSHPYNPSANVTGNWQRSSHGFSDDCNGDGVVDEDCHATRWVDIYYGIAPQPVLYNTVIEDTEGNTAPYHCHEAADPTTDYCA